MFINTITLAVDSNNNIKQTLDALCGSGRFPHAVLFEGQDNIVTEAFALHTAMRFLCKSDEKPCFHCAGCRKAMNLTHIDLTVMGDEGEKSYNIDAVREMRKNAYIRPNESLKTVFLLKNADTIPEKSQNALLKIIEEPPEHAVFILCCENRFKLLETILSRVFSFNVFSPDKKTAFDIISGMGTEFDEENIRRALDITGGNLQDSLNLLSNNAQSFKTSDTIFKAIEKRDIYSIVMFLSSAYKDKIIADVLNQLKLMIIKGSADSMKSDKTFFLTPVQAVKIADVLDESIFMANQNANKSILPCYVASQIDIIINNLKI